MLAVFALPGAAQHLCRRFIANGRIVCPRQSSDSKRCHAGHILDHDGSVCIPSLYVMRSSDTVLQGVIIVNGLDKRRVMETASRPA